MSSRSLSGCEAAVPRIAMSEQDEQPSPYILRAAKNSLQGRAMSRHLTYGGANWTKLSPRDRMQSVLDERRWRQYSRSPAAIYYHWQPQLQR